MLLNNYYKIQFLSINHLFDITSYGSTSSNNSTVTFSDIPGGLSIVTTAGTALSKSYAAFANSGIYHCGAAVGVYYAPTNSVVSQTTVPTSGGQYPNSNIIVGNGVTPVTADDYKIESEIIDGLTSVSIGKVINADLTVTYLKTMYNQSADTITISEIGLATPVTTGGAASYYKMVLVAREVLDTPMQIAPGETFTVSFSFDVF